MNKLFKDLRGVSPVIATLMLTLIAVTAASSFALFVSQKQEEVQDAEWQTTLSNLEDLKINGINWFNKSTINLSIGSFHKRSSNVYFNINNGIATNLTHTKFNISGYEKTDINLTQGFMIKDNHPITIKMISDKWGNIFERTFYPPVPLIDIETRSELVNGTPSDYYILDGSASYAMGEGVYIVDYNWTKSSSFVGSRQKIRVNSLTAGDIIILEVKDNMGMTATCSADFN